MVWLAVSNAGKILQDINVCTYFSGMKIYPVTVNTFFLVFLHKRSWEAFPSMSPKKPYIRSSQVSYSWWQRNTHGPHNAQLWWWTCASLELAWHVTVLTSLWVVCSLVSCHRVIQAMVIGAKVHGATELEQVCSSSLLPSCPLVPGHQMRFKMQHLVHTDIDNSKCGPSFYDPRWDILNTI